MVGEGDFDAISPRVRCRTRLVYSRTMDVGGGGGKRWGRKSQEEFLPRQAWTEDEEWGNPPDLLRGGDTSTLIVFESPFSSESYPECRF